MRKDEILQFLRDNKDNLHKKFGVIKIGLFGSYAKDEADKHSDIDIIVELKKESKNIHNFLSLRRFLESHLKTEVDLGLTSALKPYIKEEVIRESIYV